ncbi:hypothetical protein PPERSA_03327 [Pseudocohnilembus persalinus]|uniref:Transmembrane protein n=1 Tax=Pseudocohnilembus persalinus TaxID=266149 RepID=A0A0V0Q8G3_PSEPJ|nr:hypothetical protein PPERSA_03327 [Pseudocohnilembus persalinus]|eukprot:KRW98496.1 hypothetical protein PPERSA_03327 [Pseudocohnilembus persalinus]
MSKLKQKKLLLVKILQMDIWTLQKLLPKKEKGQFFLPLIIIKCTFKEKQLKEKLQVANLQLKIIIIILTLKNWKNYYKNKKTKQLSQQILITLLEEAGKKKKLKRQQNWLQNMINIQLVMMFLPIYHMIHIYYKK